MLRLACTLVLMMRRDIWRADAGVKVTLMYSIGTDTTMHHNELLVGLLALVTFFRSLRPKQHLVSCVDASFSMTPSLSVLTLIEIEAASRLLF